MSCEVWTTKETYICSMALRSKSELQERIRECENTIKDCKARITRLAYMTEPKKFYKDDNDVIWQINRDLEEIFEEYEEAQIKLTRLWQFEMAWDETHDNNGKAILPVDPRVLKNMSERVYMGGDYCEYVLEDGSELPEDWWDVYHGWVKPEDCSFADKLGYTVICNTETTEDNQIKMVTDEDNEIEALRQKLIETNYNVVEPEIDRTVGEMAAMMKLQMESKGGYVDLADLNEV